MKSVIAAASLSVALGYAVKRPFKFIQESQQTSQLASTTETASTSISLPYQYTDSMNGYIYNKDDGSLSSYLDTSLTEDIAADLNLEKLTMSLTESGQVFNIEEVVDFNNYVAYIYYPDYNYCESYDFSGENEVDLKAIIDQINAGEWTTYLGQKTVGWSDETFDAYEFHDKFYDAYETLYLNIDDNTWAYDSFEDYLVLEFTQSPTAATFTSDHFVISGCTPDSF